MDDADAQTPKGTISKELFYLGFNMFFPGKCPAMNMEIQKLVHAEMRARGNPAYVLDFVDIRVLLEAPDGESPFRLCLRRQYKQELYEFRSEVKRRLLEAAHAYAQPYGFSILADDHRSRQGARGHGALLLPVGQISAVLHQADPAVSEAYVRQCLLAGLPGLQQPEAARNINSRGQDHTRLASNATYRFPTPPGTISPPSNPGLNNLFSHARVTDPSSASPPMHNSLSTVDLAAAGSNFGSAGETQGGGQSSLKISQARTPNVTAQTVERGDEVRKYDPNELVNVEQFLKRLSFFFLHRTGHFITDISKSQIKDAAQKLLEQKTAELQEQQTKLKARNKNSDDEGNN
jgi:hypothetical protein